MPHFQFTDHLNQAESKVYCITPDGFKQSSPAKPKKNYRMNVDQFFPKFVAPQKFSQPYKLFVRHNFSLF